jgi:hypothetical protein
MKELLKGHTSAETAYESPESYPYGFTLRCKIRYWLEYKNGQGFRLVSQTTNPKKAGEVWNKPKASTYCIFSGAMFLDDESHVQWTGLGYGSTVEQCEAFIEKYQPEGLALDGAKAALAFTKRSREQWANAKIVSSGEVRVI